MSSTITVAAPPTTEDAAADFLAWMGAQNGVVTDINPGSQVRTMAEAAGSVMDMEGVIVQALAFQALVYSAFAAFGVAPLSGLPATVTLTFSTGAGNLPPLAPVDIAVPAGTTAQTVGGTQFATLVDAVIPTGKTFITASAAAAVAGAAGNVPAGSITQIVTSLAFPLTVNNPRQPASGGADAETPAQTLARFTAVVAAIGLGTPVAIPSGCIGVTAPNSTESVEFATCFEPWIAQLAGGALFNQLTAGFQIFIDNGSGVASPALIAAVAAYMNGNAATGAEGNRPAGVPYTVNAVVPITANVTVTGTAIQPGGIPALEAGVLTAIRQYFTLPFGTPAELQQIIATVANVVAGNVSDLLIGMTDSSGNPQQIVPAQPIQRVILGTATVVFS
jgi:hypothetical protein